MARNIFIMKRKKCCILVSILLFLFCIACIPTPNNDIVVLKGDQSIESNYEQPSFPTYERSDLSFLVSGVPKAAYQDGSLSAAELKQYEVLTTVTVDAKVVTPTKLVFPRLAIHPESLAEETMRSFVSACRPLDQWKMHCSGDGVTQENIKQQMHYYLNLIDESNPLWNAITVDGVSYDGDDVNYAKDSLFKQVQMLQEELGDAPSQLDGDRIIDQAFLGDEHLYAETEEVMPDRIYITFDNGITDEICFLSGRVLGTPAFQMNNATSRLYKRAKTHPAVPILQAQIYADAFVTKIVGVEFSLEESGTDSFINMQLPFTEWMFEGVYCFLYVPIIEGIQMNYADVPYMENELNWSNTHPETQFNEVKPQSALFVYVDETGVIGAVWKNACNYRITEALQASPNLLPFDEIMKRFNQQISYGTYFSVCNRLYPDLLPEKETLIIDRIELGYACVLSKHTSTEYELIPVWDFYGYMDEQYTKKSGYMTNKDNVRRESQTGRVYLTINAIDGTIVNRIIGY